MLIGTVYCVALTKLTLRYATREGCPVMAKEMADLY